MAFLYGWAKNGLLNRMKAVDDRLPISFVYGSQSWIDHSVAYEVKGNRKGKTEVKVRTFKWRRRTWNIRSWLALQSVAGILLINYDKSETCFEKLAFSLATLRLFSYV